MPQSILRPRQPDRPAAPHDRCYELSDLPVSRPGLPAMPIRPDDLPRRESLGGQDVGVLIWAVLAIGLAAATYGWGAIHGLLLFKIAAVVLVPLGLFAVWRGGLRKALVLGAMIGLFMLLTGNPDLVAQLINSVAGPSHPAVIAVGASVLAGLTLFLVGLFAKRLRRQLVGRSRLLARVDRFVGLSIGVVETSLLVLALCWTAQSLDTMARRITDDPEVDRASLPYQAARTLTQIGDETRRHGWSAFVRDTNPVTSVPALKELIDQLNETGRLDFDAAALDSLLPRTGASSSPQAAPAFLQKVIEEQKRSAEARGKAYRQLEQSTRR